RRRKLVVELEYQHRVGAGRGEQRLALVERGEAERRHVRSEMAHRVRVEGGDDHRAAFAPAPSYRLGTGPRVAEREAVEVAERQERAAQRIGNGIAVAEPRQACRSSVTKA